MAVTSCVSYAHLRILLESPWTLEFALIFPGGSSLKYSKTRLSFSLWAIRLFLPTWVYHDSNSWFLTYSDIHLLCLSSTPPEDSKLSDLFQSGLVKTKPMTNSAFLSLRSSTPFSLQTQPNLQLYPASPHNFPGQPSASYFHHWAYQVSSQN